MGKGGSGRTIAIAILLSSAAKFPERLHIAGKGLCLQEDRFAHPSLEFHFPYFFVLLVLLPVGACRKTELLLHSYRAHGTPPLYPLDPS